MQRDNEQTPANGGNEESNIDDVVARQEKMIKTRNYEKKRPLISVTGEKKYFDSGEYNAKIDQDRERDQEIQKAMYDQVKKIESSGVHKSHPKNVPTKKTHFDSADYYMNKDMEEKQKEIEEEIQNDLKKR